MRVLWPGIHGIEHLVSDASSVVNVQEAFLARAREQLQTKQYDGSARQVCDLIAIENSTAAQEQFCRRKDVL